MPGIVSRLVCLVIGHKTSYRFVSVGSEARHGRVYCRYCERCKRYFRFGMKGHDYDT